MPVAKLSQRIQVSDSPKRVVSLVKNALANLDHQLEQAADAMDKGELDLEDLAWEEGLEAAEDGRAC